MNATKTFLDTNVLIYAVSGDAEKATIAERYLREGGVVSVQVLTEFSDIARRKFKHSWSDISTAVSGFCTFCVVADVSLETHRRGVEISRRYDFRIFDGMIVAAALLAGCARLLTEDMQDGQRIDGMKIHNPFRAL